MENHGENDEFKGGPRRGWENRTKTDLKKQDVKDWNGMNWIGIGSNG
jgi:hypothetical protein